MKSKCQCCLKTPCEACNGRGFLLSAKNGDQNDLYIEKCDCCEQFKSDSDACEEVHKLAMKVPSLEKEILVLRQNIMNRP